jgi:hypothetical protein
MTDSQLDKAINWFTTHNKAGTREEALVGIKHSIDCVGLFNFCKAHRLLIEESAETFAIEFFEAYNKEVCANTY